MRYEETTNSLILSDHDTRRWGADELFRSNVRELLRAYARRSRAVVTLFAAPTCGGYALEEAAS